MRRFPSRRLRQRDSVQANADQGCEHSHRHLRNRPAGAAIPLTKAAIDGNTIVNASSGGDAGVDGLECGHQQRGTGPGGTMGVPTNGRATGSRVAVRRYSRAKHGQHRSGSARASSRRSRAATPGHASRRQLQHLRSNSIAQGAMGQRHYRRCRGRLAATPRSAPRSTISAVDTNTIGGLVGSNGSGINAQARVGGTMYLTLDNSRISMTDRGQSGKASVVRVRWQSSSPARQFPRDERHRCACNTLNNDVTVGRCEPVRRTSRAAGPRRIRAMKTTPAASRSTSISQAISASVTER